MHCQSAKYISNRQDILTFNDLCGVCTELLSYGTRILNPSIRITTDGASTTKATCSELHQNPVSNCSNTSQIG